MAEIAIEGADHLYREIRIENALEDEKGKAVKLKPGAQVEVTVEADPKETAREQRPNVSRIELAEEGSGTSIARRVGLTPG